MFILYNKTNAVRGPFKLFNSYNNINKIIFVCKSFTRVERDFKNSWLNMVACQNVICITHIYRVQEEQLRS